MRGTSRGPSVRPGELPEVDVLDSKSHSGQARLDDFQQTEPRRRRIK